MRKLPILFVLLLFFGIGIAQAQIKVSGKITSKEDGKALPSAAVKIKGTTQGTVSDMDGNFAIELSSPKTLQFFYLGMKSVEVVVTVSTTLNIALEADVMEIEGAVITALGISKQEKTLGYSVTQVDADELSKTQPISAMNALQGKVAGVNITAASSNPGASTRVISRGFNSLTGSNQVLYVVDGIPINNSAVGSTDINGGTDFGNRANDINPDDIESISFLKGASATVLYGSRAANGVIQITTKKGKGIGVPGSNKKAEIIYSSSYFVETPLRLPTFQNEFGQGFFGNADIIENTSWGPAFDGANRVWGHTVDNQQQIKPYSALPTNVKDFFELGKTWENTISLANNTKNGSYYFSYGNVRSDGIFPEESDTYKRNTVSLRGSSTLENGLVTSGSISYIKKQNSFVPTGQDQSVYDNILQTPRDISIVDQEDYNSTFNNLDNYYNGYAANPYYVLNEHGNNYNEDRVVGNVNFNYEILPWFSASWNIGSDIANSQLKDWRAITDYTRNNYSDDPGRVANSAYFTREITSDFLLNFNKSVNQDFDITGLLGFNLNQRNSEISSMSVTGLDIPYFYNVSNSSATPSVSNDVSKRRIIGLFGQAEIFYRRYLSLTLSARNDWSSTLPAENRSFFYPGANAAFVFTDAFPDMQKYISFGKIRLGLSQTGNDANPYLIYPTFSQANLTDGYRGLDWPLSGINAFTVGNTLGNLDLRPEITSEFEIGTILKFFQNRLFIDFTYYSKKTTDLIYPVPLAYSSGYSYKTLNLGEITNKGIELLIGGKIIKNKNFSWDISFNMGKNNNLLVSLNDDLKKVDLGGTSRLGFVAVEGMPLGVFEGVTALKDGEGHIVVDNNGLPIATTTNSYLGDGQYDWTGGVSNQLKYKNWSFSFSFDIRQGGLMYSRTKEMMYFAGTAPITTYNDRNPFIVENSVQAVYDANGNITGYTPNTVAISNANQTLYQYFDQSHGAGNFAEEWLINKSFVKLRDVVLTYTFPSEWLAKTPFGNAQFSIIGRNLLLFTPGDNHFIDPEVTTFGNDLNADYGEFTAAPTTRSFGASLKVTF